MFTFARSPLESRGQCGAACTWPGPVVSGFSAVGKTNSTQTASTAKLFTLVTAHCSGYNIDHKTNSPQQLHYSNCKCIVITPCTQTKLFLPNFSGYIQCGDMCSVARLLLDWTKLCWAAGAGSAAPPRPAGPTTPGRTTVQWYYYCSPPGLDWTHSLFVTHDSFREVTGTVSPVIVDTSRGWRWSKDFQFLLRPGIDGVYFLLLFRAHINPCLASQRWHFFAS